MSDSAEGSIRITPLVLHVLLSLSSGDAHAYGIMKDIETRTGGRVSAGPGSLHYTLSRLEESGHIEAVTPDAEETEDTRRKYFAITRVGRRSLKDELAIWADTIDLARERDLIPTSVDV